MWNTASRSLKTWGVEQNEENTKLVLALRGHTQRLQKTEFLMAQSKLQLVREDYAWKRVFLFWKSDYPDLCTQTDAKWLVDPRSLDTFPADMERQETWCVDGFYKGELQPGGVEWCTKVGVVANSNLLVPPAPAAVVDDKIEDKPLASDTGASGAQLGSGPTKSALAAPARLLTRRASDPADAVSLELIAQSAKNAADQEMYVSEDKAQNDTLECWCNVFLGCLKEQRRQFPEVEGMPEHMQMFVQFVIEDVLLEKDVYNHLPVVRAFLESAEACYPKSLNKLGYAILQLAAAPLSGNEDVVIEGLREKKAHRFRSSNLYSGFVRARYQKKVRGSEGCCRQRECSVFAGDCGVAGPRWS
jgi:hypothetical protein